jgi:hypothetical protein
VVGEADADAGVPQVAAHEPVTAPWALPESRAAGARHYTLSGGTRNPARASRQARRP